VLPAFLFGLLFAVGIVVTIASRDDPPASPPNQGAPAAIEPGPLATIEPGTLMYVTSPSLATLRDLGTLVNRSILSVDNLRIVAAYPKDERKQYEEARAWIAARGLENFATHLFDCSVSEGDVFQANECTPAFNQIAQEASGLLLPGGADIPPSIYGEATLLATEVRTPGRHRFEISLLAHMLGTGCPDCPEHLLEPELGTRVKRLPILAICLGMQTLNVARGGTLVQDIPSLVYGLDSYEAVLAQDLDMRHREPAHRVTPDLVTRRFSVHPIRLEAEWPFPIGSTTVEVTSSHHQAIKTLGHGLEVAARSMDGRIIEALRVQGYPKTLGVQFHPEYRVLWKRDPAGKDPALAPLRSAESRSFHRALWDWFGREIQAANHAGYRNGFDGRSQDP
jgi:putative glutamine amidotransferase